MNRCRCIAIALLALCFAPRHCIAQSTEPTPSPTGSAESDGSELLHTKLKAPHHVRPKPEPPVLLCDDGTAFGDDWNYGTPVARELIQKAREFDPAHCPRDKQDREQAVSYYQLAMDAQPGSKLNAVLANRIAQMYATFANPEAGIHTDQPKAAEWWDRCVKLTDPTQMLFAQAHMGLACTGMVRRDTADSVDHLDVIMKMNPEAIQLDDWAKSTYLPKTAWHETALNRIREEFRELQAEAKSMRKDVRKVDIARERKLEAAARTGSRVSYWIALNALILVGMAVVAIRYRMKHR